MGGLPKRDTIATALVGVAGLAYLLWALDATLPGMSSTRASGIVVLALGFVASAIAVVPTFDQLLRGNKAYLAVTSLIGLVAFVSGVVMLITASDEAFTVMTVALVLLWVIATIHHVVLAQTASAPPGIPSRQTTNHSQQRVITG